MEKEPQMKTGALFSIPLVTTLLLFPLHPILAGPPKLGETYQKWIKTRIDSLIVRGKLRLTPYSIKYNMPIATPDPNIVYNMPIVTPDPNIVYNMPGARTPQEIPRPRLPKQFSLPDTLKLRPRSIPAYPGR